MLLHALDQEGRSRLPGYTGYKPRSGEAAAQLQPAQGPTKRTTTGFANAQVRG